MKKATLLLLALAGLGAAACNTVEGVGRDIQSAGAGIARSADDVRGGSYRDRERDANRSSGRTSYGPNYGPADGNRPD